MARGEFCLVRLNLPGRAVENGGVLLLDPDAGRLHCRFREDWDEIADAGDAEALAALAEGFHDWVAELGGARVLAWWEDCASNAVQIGEREPVLVDSFTRVLERLYARHVAPVNVIPFSTHLPLYSLRAAAGRFGEEQAVEPEDWAPAPGLRLSEGMFVAHVEGRSMEPRIPDGSLNVFRAPVVGSRQNKIVLVELFGEWEETARYTVKKYTSIKSQRGEQWRHERIRLEPLNPEFAAFDLAEGQFRTIAEWITTLD